MHAHVILELTNVAKTSSCSVCGDQGPITIIEMDTPIPGWTMQKAFCKKHAEIVLSESTGDPRVKENR